ncbi:MAG: transposase [Tannerella sp.]|jgi:hypothetical protein|nr:transposase [Tannerella sp.]
MDFQSIVVKLYKCYCCGKQFSSGFRLDNSVLWEEYTVGKQTCSQFADKYKCSIKTVQRRLDRRNVPVTPVLSRKVIVLMDTTYRGRDFGVILFKNAPTSENLLRYHVKHETNALYIQGINGLQKRGFTVVAMVCDGRKGPVQSFGDIPVQLCQFHRTAIIRRYLMGKPKLQAGRELLEVVELLSKTDKESFAGALGLWFEKWEEFLNERSVYPLTRKTFYTHKKLRSACRSLKNNLPWLFTWYGYFELNIPDTTNAVDGHFADLKNRLRNHTGLSEQRKMKFIDRFMKA